MSDGLFVHGHKLAAKHRRYSDGAVPHVWQLGVDAVTQATLAIGRNLEAADGLADELEFALGLQFGMRRGAVSRSVRGEFAITEALSRRHVDDAAHFRAELPDRRVRPCRRRFHEHFAHSGAGNA